MKTYQLNARAIATSPDPIQALANVYDAPANSLEELQRVLQSRKKYTLTEVLDWQTLGDEWKPIGFLLEAVQQHSSYFFLIWGTQNDLVDTKAKSAQEELIQEQIQTDRLDRVID